MMIFVALALANATPVPPPIEQESADCEHSSYASDQLVCSDESLTALDRELKALLPVRAEQHGLLIEPQTDWFKRSRVCAFQTNHLGCLRAAYRERIAIVRAAHQFDVNSMQWIALKCGKAAIDLGPLDNGVYAVRRDDKIELALAATELAAWKPYLAMTEVRSKTRLLWANGSVVRCGRMSKP